MLECHDQFKVLVMQAVAQVVADLRDREQDQLAIKIANAVAKIFGAS